MQLISFQTQKKSAKQTQIRRPKTGPSILMSFYKVTTWSNKANRRINLNENSNGSQPSMMKCVKIAREKIQKKHMKTQKTRCDMK